MSCKRDEFSFPLKFHDPLKILRVRFANCLNKNSRKYRLRCGIFEKKEIMQLRRRIKTFSKKYQ